MRGFLAFWKKEWLESLRTGKLVALGALFVGFGVMNPAIAKLTPWLIETLAGELAESGMIVTAVTVDAITAWTQFFKNIPMALIAFLLAYTGIFAKEYASGSLVLMLTKGLARYKVVLAKAAVMLTGWTAGYWLCFAVTYGYAGYYWDNAVAPGLLPAALQWWLFGLWVVALLLLFSTLCRGYAGALLGTGGGVIVAYLAGLLPAIKDYSPTALTAGAARLLNAEAAEESIGAVALTALLTVAAVAAAIPCLNKKAL